MYIEKIYISINEIEWTVVDWFLLLLLILSLFI